MRVVIVIFLLLFFAGIGTVGYLGYPFYRLYRLKDSHATFLEEGKKVHVLIPSKASPKTVATILEKKDAINSIENFLFFANAKNYNGRRIVPGKYQIKYGMTYNQLVNHLRAGNGRLNVKISFHYIKNLADLAKKVAPQIEASEKALLNVLQDSRTAQRYKFKAITFPTMFLPDTYKINWATSPEKFVKVMARKYKTFWNRSNRRKARAQGLSPSEVAVLASIVQAEQSKRPDEWPKIAGLYLNRLKRNIKLEADPTVKFAVGQPGLRRVLNKHLKVDSPYNTYRYHGLPPGPLSIPEKGAILAVLNPQKHPYIFMCAKPEYSGYHNFSRTLKQHKRYARMYHRWLNKQGIR